MLSNQSSLEEKLQGQLHSEGFGRTYVWEDAPNTFYPEHTHPSETAHIILEGEMTLVTGGKQQTYRQGERCDVPARVVHSARMGPKGCRYLIGERWAGLRRISFAATPVHWCFLVRICCVLRRGISGEISEISTASAAWHGLLRPV